MAKFVFNDINLPDSNINKISSNGFVNFIIAQKADLPILTEITNQAGIYFDYNAPVATNLHRLVVSTSIATTTPEERSTLIRVYPNPAENGQCWIHCTDPDRSLQQVIVYDATGRTILNLSPNSNRFRLQLPESPGIYWIKVILEDGNSSVERVSR